MDEYSFFIIYEILYYIIYYHVLIYYHQPHVYLSCVAEGKCRDGAQGGFNPVAELEKLRRTQQERCRLEIGELLRVRGPVKTSRQQREIQASTYCEFGFF